LWHSVTLDWAILPPGVSEELGSAMENIAKLPRAAKASDADSATLDELHRRIAELTEENAALRQRAEELLAYKNNIAPIIFTLMSNPFADIDSLRHKAHKAMRPAKPGS
jgi:hypothetical protein